MKVYYVYKVTLPETKQYYIGSRGFEGNIMKDKYVGSMYTWKITKEQMLKLEKTILAEGFETMRDAIQYEREEIIKHIKDPLNMNGSIPHPDFNHEGKISAKDKNGKTVSLWINDPLFGIDYFGVTKGKVQVKDSEGNRFIVYINDPRYLNGELIHINKGNNKRENHPGFGKIWINNNKIQIRISPDKLKKYLKEGWVEGTLQRGKKSASSHSGSCWVHNNEETKRINKSELEFHLSQGYKEGRGKLGTYKKNK